MFYNIAAHYIIGLQATPTNFKLGFVSENNALAYCNQRINRNKKVPNYFYLDPTV
jgi:hypothetical protein